MPYSWFDSEATVGPISNITPVLNRLLEGTPSLPIVDLVPARAAALRVKHWAAPSLDAIAV